MTRTGPKGQDGKAGKDARAERLEQALRENLKRRKAQARARKTDTEKTTGNGQSGA